MNFSKSNPTLLFFKQRIKAHINHRLLFVKTKERLKKSRSFRAVYDKLKKKFDFSFDQAPPPVRQPSCAIVRYAGVKKGKPSDISKVAFILPNKHDHSKRYRVYNLIENFVEEGIDCYTIDERYNGTFDKFPLFDIVIAFRVPHNKTIQNLFSYFNSKNIPLIADIDDLIFDEHRISEIDEFKYLDSKQQADFLNRMSKIRDTICACSFATVTTETLKREVERLGIDAAVIPNAINNEQLEIASRIDERIDDGTIRIGYYSGSRTHQMDFEVAAPAIFNVLSKYPNVQLHIVGFLTLSRKFNALKRQIIPTDYLSHQDMLRHMSRMDIIIAPLVSSPFNDAKSELKIFESALLRIPVVASSTASYSACIEHGVTGYIAQNQDDWEQYLISLITDSSLRNEMGEKARTTIVPCFLAKKSSQMALDVYRYVIKKNEKAKTDKHRVLSQTDNDHTKNSDTNYGPLVQFDAPFFRERHKSVDAPSPLPISVIVTMIEERRWFTEEFVIPAIQQNNPAQIIVIDDPKMDIQQKRNLGIKKANQKYLFLCDDDIILPCNHLARLLKALEDKDDSIGYAYSDYQAIVLHPETHPMKGNFYFRSKAFDAKSLLRGNYISTMTLIRRDICPNFDESIVRYQDWDAWLTLLKQNITGVHVPGTGFFAFYLDAGITSTRVDREKAREKIKAKHQLSH